MTDVSDVLNAAADRLETHGWCKGKYGDGERRCIVGAIYEVTGESGPLVSGQSYDAIATLMFLTIHEATIT